jgi:hypothetical protein
MLDRAGACRRAAAFAHAAHRRGGDRRGGGRPRPRSLPPPLLCHGAAAEGYAAPALGNPDFSDHSQAPVRAQPGAIGSLLHSSTSSSTSSARRRRSPPRCAAREPSGGACR